MSESNTNTVENTPVERTITIYATRGNSEPVDIISSAVTWGDFIPEVERAGYSVNKVLCTESHTRMDLVNKLAILPVVDFTIFIRNKETKSGAEELGYKDLRAAIKDFMANYPVEAKAHFGNYTTKTTVDLRELHSSFQIPTPAGAETVEAEEVKNVADVVESVKESKVILITNLGRVEKISALLAGIVNHTSNEEILERVGIIEEEIEGLRAAVTSDDEETFKEEEVETIPVPTVVDAEEEGRKQARKEAKEAEEAEKQAKIARKKKLADEAKSLGL